jgi:hypothetical protein
LGPLADEFPADEDTCESDESDGVSSFGDSLRFLRDLASEEAEVETRDRVVPRGEGGLGGGEDGGRGAELPTCGVAGRMVAATECEEELASPLSSDDDVAFAV